MTAEWTGEIVKLENQLSMVENELWGWERYGSKVHIDCGRVLVQSLRRQLDALRRKPRDDTEARDK